MKKQTKSGGDTKTNVNWFYNLSKRRVYETVSKSLPDFTVMGDRCLRKIREQVAESFGKYHIYLSYLKRKALTIKK